MRILIIEDEVTLNRTLQEGLNDEGYQVDIAENFKDAEYYIDIRNYDLVLTDWMLPDGDGLELTKIVKNSYFNDDDSSFNLCAGFYGLKQHRSAQKSLINWAEIDHKAYLDEYAARFNTRHLTSQERFENFLVQSESVLSYKVLISNA